MSSETAVLANGSAVDTALLPLDNSLVILDGRTKLARRVRALKDIYSDAVGGERALTPLLAQRIEDAAMKRGIAELTRARFVEGTVGPDDLVRVEGMATRAEKLLGLGSKLAKAPVAPSLARSLREEALAKAGR